MRISELVTVKEVNGWKDGDVVTIDAQTGAGKSYFIKNILYAHAKRDGAKILLLVHRITCLDQFQNELIDDGKLDVIDIRTYQSIDDKMKRGKSYKFDKYKYVVSDEFHYFLSDSWNKLSDLSLNCILKATDKIRIFMSATGDYVKKYIQQEKGIKTIDYTLPRNYSHIKKLEFYRDDDSIHDYISRIIGSDKKGIVFIKSAQRAYDLHQMYKKHSMFLCSANNTLYKYVDTDKRTEMLNNERFEDKLLFTTLTLEAGVNLIDSQLTEIICDTGFDIGILQQVMGRKRIEHKDDYINLYIKAITNNVLGGKKSKIQDELDVARDFICKENNEFVRENYRKYINTAIVYDEPTPFGYEKQLNYIRKFKVECDVEMINEMIKLGNKNLGYCLYVSNLFNIPYTIKEESEVLSELEVYLDSLVGKKLFNDERWELIQKVGLKDKQYRLQKGINQLNAYFEGNKILYLIKKDMDWNRSILVDGEKVKNYAYGKTFWVIGKINFA